MSKVVVVGSLIVDISARVPHFPVAGETVLGPTVRFGPGGKGNNQATAAARAGAQVTLVARVGDDFLGGIMTAHCDAEGMSRRYVRVCPGRETGSALIEVEEPTGENRIIVVKGANDDLTREDVIEAKEAIAGCDVVLAQLETSLASVLAAKALAREYGKPFVLNPAPFQAVPEELLPGIDWLIPNETEAAFFSGRPVGDTAGAARALHRMGVHNVIITLGREGAYFYNGQRELHIPTTDLAAVDTTGAGDAFCGAFCVALAEGMKVGTALEFANCAASISVTRLGTSPAMPRRVEIDALHQKYFRKQGECP